MRSDISSTAYNEDVHKEQIEYYYLLLLNKHCTMYDRWFSNFRCHIVIAVHIPQ